MRENTISNILLSLVVIFFVMSLCACRTTRGGVHVGWEPESEIKNSPSPEKAAKGGPPPHAPAHGYRAKHVYYYYPHAQVYFDISKEVYFYMEGQSWKISASLPSSLHVQLGDHVTLEMDTHKPYTHFKDHKKKYPPGQLKKKKGKRAKNK